ncbi:MAG: HEAT repeat domain-containing protein [Planctomycetota bacterium]
MGPQRPTLGLGLQPLIQSLRATDGASSLLGIVEPWEVWWTRNRDMYLSFKEDVQWEKIVADSNGTMALTIYPIYDELVKVLGKALYEQDLYIALRAAIALGKAGSAYNFTALDILKKANDNDKRFFVRNNELFGLGLSGDISTAKVIKEVLQKKNEGGSLGVLRRSYAALASGYIANDPEIPKILKNILYDNDYLEVKCCACLSLGNLKDTSAVLLLSKILNLLEGGGKEQPVLRAYAALGLGRIGTKEALDVLKKSTPATEKEADVNSAVVVALGMIGEPAAKDSIISFLTDKRNPKVCGLAAIALAQIRDAKSYELISEALQKNESNDADGLMLIALGLTGDERAKADLRKVLEGKESRDLLKAASAIGLGLLKDNRAVPIITRMLSDDKQLNNVILAPYLIISLGMIQDQRGIDVLQKIWNKMESDNSLLPYHTNVAVALTMLGKKKYVILPKLIQQAGQSKNLVLRLYALHTLGLLGDRESAQIFIEAYKDSNTYVRYATLTGIGFLMDKSNLNPINKVTANSVDISMDITDHILLIPVW